MIEEEHAFETHNSKQVVDEEAHLALVCQVLWLQGKLIDLQKSVNHVVNNAYAQKCSENLVYPVLFQIRLSTR